jgi:hypothetical protein
MRKTCATWDKLGLAQPPSKSTPYFYLFAIPDSVNGRNWKTALKPSAQIAADDPDDDGARRSRRAPSDSLPGRYQLGMPISGGSGGSICRYARYWHLMVPRARPPPLCMCVHRQVTARIPSHPLPDATRTAGVHCRLSTWAGAHGLHNRAHRRRTTRVAPNNKCCMRFSQWKCQYPMTRRLKPSHNM